MIPDLIGKTYKNAAREMLRRGSVGRTLVHGVLAVASLIAANWGIDLLASKLAYGIVKDQTGKQALNWQSRIIGLLRYKEESFKLSMIAEDDKPALAHFIQASDTYRFVLFDSQASVFWSSKVSKIGSVEDGDIFRKHMRLGQLHHAFVSKRLDEIDQVNMAYTAAGSYVLSGQPERIVAEIYVPVFDKGQFVGAVEHYKDVTDDIHWHTRNIRLVGSIMAALAAVLVLTVMWQVVFTGRRRENALKQIAERQTEALTEKSQRNRENRLISELNEWLQSCRSMDELYDMVGIFLAKLLPRCAGSLYIYSNSRDQLVGAKVWNGGKLLPSIHADDCWGLRRGRTYNFGRNEVNFACSHVGGEEAPYCCIPIVAHGDTIGMLHFTFSSATRTNATDIVMTAAEERKLSLLCAEQISLAIANVRLRDQLRDQSIKDPLTGLFNKRYMLETMRRELARCRQAGQGLAILSIDVDHFKTFNDNHGHDAGDVVLRAVGETLAKSIRGEDVACRNGGEEFVIVMPNIDLATALGRAEGVRANISALSLRYANANLPRITVSIGVAGAPEHCNEVRQLLLLADAALYEAKRSGRNKVVSAAVRSEESAAVAELEGERDVAHLNGAAACGHDPEPHVHHG